MHSLFPTLALAVLIIALMVLVGSAIIVMHRIGVTLRQDVAAAHGSFMATLSRVLGVPQAAAAPAGTVSPAPASAAPQASTSMPATAALIGKGIGG